MLERMRSVVCVRNLGGGTDYGYLHLRLTRKMYVTKTDKNRIFMIPFLQNFPFGT
jgi:hypothetical protein